MKKKLIFNFYVSWDTVDCYVNRLHIRLLSDYAHVFDEMQFNMSIDDPNDFELIEYVEKKLLKLQKDSTIIFKIKKNTPFRESLCMYDEIYNNKDDKCLLFFGHNKGITNIDKKEEGQDKGEIESILSWIIGLYYFSFIDMREVDFRLWEDNYLAYGPFLCLIDEINNRYGYMYYGTFFWVNNGSFQRYKEKHSIHYDMYNRFYSELMIGECVPFESVYSHDARYLTLNAENAKIDFYRYTNDYIRIIYSEEEANDFFEYKNKILSELGDLYS